MIFHCTKCGNELIVKDEESKSIKKNQKFKCPFCSKTYSLREVKDRSDIEMMDADLEIWKEAQKFK